MTSGGFGSDYRIKWQCLVVCLWAHTDAILWVAPKRSSTTRETKKVTSHDSNVTIQFSDVNHTPITQREKIAATFCGSRSSP